MSPEMVTDAEHLSPQTDIYSLGCVAYWLLTGHQVFEASSPMAIMVAHAKSPPAPPSTVSELEIPPELDRVVLSCLEKEPGARPASAAELDRLLEAVDFTAPWTAEGARAWWETHQPTAAGSSRPGV